MPIGLHRLMPEISIGVIHGGIDKEEIEETMMKFYNGEIDVLVCTSIIENGIDIPNANMIIVEDSRIMVYLSFIKLKEEWAEAIASLMHI